MRRASVITFLVGFVFIIIGATGVLPGSGTFGILVAFSALLFFGLSYIRRPQATPDAPPPLSAISKLIYAFVEPGRVFKDLHLHPRWLVALLIIVLSSFTYNLAFMHRVTPEVVIAAGVNRALDAGLMPPTTSPIEEMTIIAVETPKVIERKASMMESDVLSVKLFERL
jgi:hypothetical protein